jgi:D-amino-acid dehydrogenase
MITGSASDPQHEVVIIGAGIVGLCAACYLQQAGCRVTLIDKGDPGQRTSYGNAGVISPWSCVPQAMPGVWKQLPAYFLARNAPARVRPTQLFRYIPWLLRFLRESAASRVAHNADAMFQLCGDSVFMYRQLLQHTGSEALIKDSLQVHAFRQADAADINALSYALRRQKGATARLLDAAALHDLEPALTSDFKAAVVMPDMARTLNPGRLGSVLAEKIRRQGGAILQGEVKSLSRSKNGWTLEGPGRTVQAKSVVVAAGAWSADLLKPFGISLPLAAERGYHLWFDEADAAINHSVMDVDAHVIASSMEGGIRIAGMAEFADADSPANAACVRKMQRIATAMIPALADVASREWMGVRSSFPDSLPVIEAFDGYGGLFAAFGHSHYGLMMAPKTGQLVAQLLTGQRPNIDMSVYRSARFLR